MAGGGARGVLAAGGERQAAAACISLGRTIARNAPASRCTPARVPSDATPPPCGAHTQLEPKDQIITAEPDVLSQRLTPADTFLVLACDGIWDVMDKCVRALPPARVPPCLRWLEARCAARRRACSLAGRTPTAARRRRLPCSARAASKWWTLCGSGWARAWPHTTSPRSCSTPAWRTTRARRVASAATT